jgi:hypothetical protein
MTRFPVVCAALLVLPFSLFGQDSTAKGNTTPFHKGQWAAQFQAGFAFGSLGFIKFRSPTHALVIDLRISGAHREDLGKDSTGASQLDVLSSGASVQARFGWRRYAGDGNGTKVVSHYSFGMLAGFGHSVYAVRQTGHSQVNGWTVGAFGDLGGTYLLTPKFGVGALATAEVTYGNSVLKTSSGGRSREWSIGGSAVGASLVATLYF